MRCKYKQRFDVYYKYIMAVVQFNILHLIDTGHIAITKKHEMRYVNER